jgi:hypothetical protein
MDAQGACLAARNGGFRRGQEYKDQLQLAKSVRDEHNLEPQSFVPERLLDSLTVVKAISKFKVP